MVLDNQEPRGGSGGGATGTPNVTASGNEGGYSPPEGSPSANPAGGLGAGGGGATDTGNPTPGTQGGSGGLGIQINIADNGPGASTSTIVGAPGPSGANNGSLAVAAVVVITTVAVLPLMVVGVEDLVEQVVILPQDHQVVLEQVVMFQQVMHPSQDLGMYSLATMKGVQQHMELVGAVVVLLGPTQVLMLEVMVVLVLLLLGINYQQMQQLMIHQLKQLVEQPM